MYFPQRFVVKTNAAAHAAHPISFAVSPICTILAVYRNYAKSVWLMC
jgi:hypothetical protein